MLTATKTSTKPSATATPMRTSSKRWVTPSLSASGARKANVLPSNLLVVLPNSLLGCNNLTLVTPLTLRYQDHSVSLMPPVTRRGPALSPLLYFC
jgi:hypothetical protein